MGAAPDAEPVMLVESCRRRTLRRRSAPQAPPPLRCPAARSPRAEAAAPACRCCRLRCRRASTSTRVPPPSQPACGAKVAGHTPAWNDHPNLNAQCKTRRRWEKGTADAFLDQL